VPAEALSEGRSAPTSPTETQAAQIRTQALQQLKFEKTFDPSVYAHRKII
jgi:hypothetical protein